MTLSDLLGKLEEASEGSRELDAEIAMAVGWWRDCSGLPPVWFTPDGERAIRNEPPHFSDSLDAALTLVPELCEVHLNIYGGPARATAYFDGGEYVESDDKPAAMALVIVALKARQALSSTGDK